MRTNHGHAEQLRTIPGLRGLKHSDLTLVDRLGTLLEVEAGERFIEEGSPGRQAFLLVGGQATVSVGGHDVATVGPGDVLGEVSLLDCQPRTATVTATERLQLVVFDPRSFSTLLGQPRFARLVLDGAARRLRTADSVVGALPA